MVDSVVIKSEPTGPTAPAPQQGAPAADNSQRPTWLPEKFDSPEKLAEAYTNLEKEFSRRNQQQQPAPQPPPDVRAPNGPEGDEGADIAAFQAALADMVKYKLTGEEAPDELYEAFAKSGLPPEFLGQLVEGQAALVKQVQSAIYEQVGGEDAYKSMMEWGLTNLNDAERDAFDAALTRSEQDAFMAVQSLAARYQNAVGRNPNLIRSDGLGGSVDAYESIAQMKVDMKDPRYKTDPAFRAKVEAKIARSSVL